MSLLKYNKECLPDPRGDVSLSISSWAIALVNHEVKEELSQQKKPVANISCIMYILLL